MDQTLLEKICGMSQKEVKSFCKKELKKRGYDVLTGDGYVYAEGTFPVLLVAHMDTVHKEQVQELVHDILANALSSPQGIGGDDRCGIYAILEIVKEMKCSVLFCEDEEIGAVGAQKFLKTDKAKEINVNYIIELDRAGKDDAVFYECDNPEFTKFILEDGEWQEQYGSFSDISWLAPELGTAAVNFSCGYYNAHRTNEYIKLNELDDCIHKVINLLKRTTDEHRFEYIELKYSYGKYWDSMYSSYYSDWSKKQAEKKATKKYYHDDFKTYYCELFDCDHGDYVAEEIVARSKSEAVGELLMMYDHISYDDVSCVLCEDEV